MKKQVLLILPNKDFDITETSVSWKILSSSDVDVDFATADGDVGQGDPILLNSVVFGMMGASEEAKKCYYKMIGCDGFKNPKRFDDTDFMFYDGIILPGGHAQGMKPYLEDTTLRTKLVPFFKDNTKITGAVCHGVLVLARTIDPSTGKSLLYKRRSTCLLKYLERSAYFLSFWKLGRYYRTYDKYVEDEVRESMQDPIKQLDTGKCNTFGSLDEKYASVCVDQNYVSARWPGDVKLFANMILEKLQAIN